MLDTLIKISEFLYKLFAQIKCPIFAEVNDIRYRLVENRTSDIVIHTPHPSTYQVNLKLTNRSGFVVFVKDIMLTINDSRTYKCIQPKIRLEAREPIEQNVIFPVDSETKPDRKGKFVLEIIPGVGRKKRIKGFFPKEETVP